MVYLVLLLALVMNASANILLKIGMLRINQAHAATLLTEQAGQEGILSLFLRMTMEPAIITGIILFAANVLAYSWVLGRLALSIAYPIMTTGGFLIVILFSWLSLKEPVSPIQLLGLVFILSGIWMLAR